MGQAVEENMFVGHLPAGYCLTTTLLKYFGCKDGTAHRRYLWIGLLASVLPDVDMIYFYLIDHRQHWHHSYWTHIPIYWITGAYGLLSLGKLFRSKGVIWGTAIGVANLILHLILDSIASKIRWLYPVSGAGYGLFRIPSGYGWWPWNYLLHWTFLIEVVIVLMAGCMIYYRSAMELYKPNIKGSVRTCG